MLRPGTGRGEGCEAAARGLTIALGARGGGGGRKKTFGQAEGSLDAGPGVALEPATFCGCSGALSSPLAPAVSCLGSFPLPGNTNQPHFAIGRPDISHSSFWSCMRPVPRPQPS